MQKSDFKKLSDWLWEIPKSFRSDMRVPVRVYASEKMLEDIFRDRSLGQLVNVATLPGIVNYSMAMPDMHEGYGFCIGGVAAMDLKSGVISPGGVGYDINCLDGDAKILHSLGYYLPIKGFERKNSDVIKCVNFKEKKIEDTSILAFLKRKANPSVFEVVTKTGQKIKTTPDHPFYTPNGMIELKKLKEGDKIAIFPFEGVRYEKPSNKTIVSENDLKRTLLKLGRKPGDVRFDQNIRALEKRSLLSLTYSHPKLPYLLKIMGFILGDGAMNFIGKRKDGITYFVGKPEDLEEIREDIKKIGYTPSPIHYRKRKIKAEVREEYSFIVNAASLVIFLQSLGIPLGNKTHQAYRVPRWIFDCSLWQKRLFLAAFFGAELRIPHRRKGRRTMFNCPVLQMNKAERLIPSGRAFLDDISRLLKEFNVKTVYIAQRKRHVSTGGDVTWGLDLVFSSKIDSLINLWLKVGFEYNKKRQLVANIAGQYLRFKREILKEKRKAIETTIPRLLNTGLSYYNIAQQLATSNPLTKRFIIDVCWKLKKGRKKIIPQVSSAFPSFSQYSNEVTQGFNDIGMIWEEIVEIKKIPYKNWVYDFTVNHQDHNFIANNFVVSNCGMKLLKSDFSEKDIKPHLENLATEIQKEVPSGLGRGRQIKLDISSIDKILEEGAQRLVTQGYGEKEDLENCESGGRLPQADATLVSDHAKNRGRDQVGTLGSGNHFLEIQKVEEIFDENIAKVFGLFENQIVIMIHTGSRGLGHQIATDYIQIMMRAMPKYGIRLPDQELAACPINSPEGKRYFSAMSAGANYAWANRQMITHFIRKAWRAVLGEKISPLVAVYDVAHNIAKIEQHKINGEEEKLCLHRKGATRAFPGQPVLIPGSMGTASYVLVGTETGKDSWYSTCHGAGRTMSRHEAMRRVSGQEVVNKLEQKGIIVKCWSLRGIAEEAPMAYKDVNEVVEVVHNAGLSKKVAKLVPLAVIKGE